MTKGATKVKSKVQQLKDNYLNEKVETFVVRVPKGQKSIIQEQAKAKGLSLNSYIVKLIKDDREKDVE